MYDELQYWGFENACFVTLTYDNEHLPLNGSLVRDELSRFFKRLRKDLSNDCRKIKCFACGEYGDQFSRPHYHAIIFGLSPFKQSDRDYIIRNWGLCNPNIFNWKHKGDIWLKGNAIDIVNEKTFRYVAKYIQKRLNGKRGEIEYTEKGIIPPYSYKSKGLGFAIAEKEVQFMQENGFLYFNGKSVPIPKSYKDKFGIKSCMMKEKVNNSKMKIFNEQLQKTTVQMVLNSIKSKYVSMYGNDFVEKKSIFSAYEKECMEYMIRKEEQSHYNFEKSFVSYKGVR